MKFNSMTRYLIKNIKYSAIIFCFYCLTNLSLEAQETVQYAIQTLILKTDTSVTEEEFNIRDFLECLSDDLVRYKIHVMKVYRIKEQSISESSIPSFLNRLYRREKKIDTKDSISSYNAHRNEFENIDTTKFDTLFRNANSTSDKTKDSNYTNFAVELGFNTKKHLSSILEVSIQWIDLNDSIYSRINKIEIEKSEYQSLIQRTANRVSESIALNIQKKIRIVIEKFHSDLGDSLIRKFGSSLEYSLGTALAKTRWIGILLEETDTLGKIQPSKQFQLQSKSRLLKHIYMQETAAKSGKLIFPDFRITGSVAAVKNGLRVDCWLASIESQMVEAAEGFSTNGIELNKINGQIQAMANRLSYAIKTSYLLQKDRRKSFFIVPSRFTKLRHFNLARIMEVLRGLNIKLASILDNNQTYILENYSRIKDYLLQKEIDGNDDYDNLIRSQNSDYLLVFDLEETDTRFSLRLTLEPRSDIKDKPISDFRKGQVYSLDDSLNKSLEIIFWKPGTKYSRLLSKDIQKNMAFVRAFRDTEVPQAFKKYFISLFTGLDVHTSNEQVYLDERTTRLWLFDVDLMLSPISKSLPFIKHSFLGNFIFGMGGSFGFSPGSIKFPDEIPEISAPDSVGNFELKYYLLGLHPLILRQFGFLDLQFSTGPTLFFITRPIATGTAKRREESDLYLGLSYCANLRFPIRKSPLYNWFISFKIGGTHSLNTINRSIKYLHPFSKEIDLSQIYQRGFAGGFFFTGGFSFNLNL